MSKEIIGVEGLRIIYEDIPCKIFIFKGKLEGLNAILVTRIARWSYEVIFMQIYMFPEISRFHF